MDDLISRQAAITLPVMPKEHREYQTYNLDDAYEQGWIDLQKCIEELPSAQSERKRGWWKRYNTYHGDDTSGFVDPDWRCSECGRQANIKGYLYDLTNFCPNCGADMRGEEDG